MRIPRRSVRRPPSPPREPPPPPDEEERVERFLRTAREAERAGRPDPDIRGRRIGGRRKWPTAW